MKITSVILAILVLLVPTAEVFSQSTGTRLISETKTNDSIDQTGGIICEECGKKNSEFSLFCSCCGSALKKSDATPSSPDSLYKSKIIAQTVPDLGFDDTYSRGAMDGGLSASENYSAGGWFYSGIASGFFSPILGIGVIAGVSIMGNPEPPITEMMRIQDKSFAYQSGFLRGYSKKARSKRLRSSSIGGLLGTTAIVIVMISS